MTRRRAVVALVAATLLGLTLSPSARAGAATDPAPPVPANSGSGRRVVYDMGQMRVWLVEWDGTVTRTYRVSGHKYRTLPGTGEFWVFSKSRYNSVKGNPNASINFMVRFAKGESGLDIGFHEIPANRRGPVQSVASLGTPTSHGCVRQSTADARFLFDWAEIGTTVVVVDTSGRARPAPKSRVAPNRPVLQPPPPQIDVVAYLRTITGAWPLPVG